MNPELRKLIKEYLSVALDLVPKLSLALKFELPVTNEEWVALDIPQIGSTDSGIEYFKHGYGVKIKDSGRVIDIDFGNNGEYDGFDAWRLFSFSEESNISTSYTDHREIEYDIKEAVSAGELIFSGYILYYLNNAI